MSDLPRSAALLQRHSPQLPVSWYFDQRLFELEQRHLYTGGPGYVGHALQVANVGDYHTLPWVDHARALVRNPAGITLIDNICRHRQAIMLEGRGNVPNIVCPLHRWTYDLSGKLLGAPHFPENPCLALGTAPLADWNGLQFAGGRNPAEDLADLGPRERLDFSGYVYDRTIVSEYQQNWKTFIEVYLEDYHVEPFHPGLGNFVSCDNLQWEFGTNYSVQTVGVHGQLEKPGTPTYTRWHDEVRRYHAAVGSAPLHGAIWMLYYPNVMVEWYPNVLIVSTLIPRGPQHTTNIVEFYYPEEIALFERGYVDAQQAAYQETAVEDDEIAVRMDRGRRALNAAGRDDAGPYQSPMEDGMVHFHEYIRRNLEPHRA